MNYGELKTAVATDSHRPDLAGEIPGFIRRAEGMLFRELRALPLSGTIVGVDGIYTLPAGVLEIRNVTGSGPDGRPRSLEQVGLAEMDRIRAGNLTFQAFYCVRQNDLEVRGGSADIIVEYLGHPEPLSDDADTNLILSEHQDLYLEASLFFLYKHVQDLELAQGALDTWSRALETINEQYGRKAGGARIAPAYSFTPRRSGRY